MTVRVTAFGGCSTAGSTGARRRDHLGDAKVTLRRGCQQIRLLVEVGVNVRVECVMRLSIGGDDEGGEVVGDGRMVRRSVDGVDCRHDGQRYVGSS